MKDGVCRYVKLTISDFFDIYNIVMFEKSFKQKPTIKNQAISFNNQLGQVKNQPQPTIFNPESEAMQNGIVSTIGTEGEKRKEFQISLSEVENTAKMQNVREKLELTYQKHNLKRISNDPTLGVSEKSAKKSLVEARITELEKQISTYKEVSNNLGSFDEQTASEVWQNELEEKTFVATDKLNRQWLVGHGNVQLEGENQTNTHYIQDPQDPKKTIKTVDLIAKMVKDGKINPNQPLILCSCHIGEDLNLEQQVKEKTGVNVYKTVQETGVVYSKTLQLENEQKQKIGDLITLTST
jgi:hypothetical protein